MPIIRFFLLVGYGFMLTILGQFLIAAVDMKRTDILIPVVAGGAILTAMIVYEVNALIRKKR